ncbi:DUF4917 family protein [Pantoea agglomerans]|uniref:DUF4917 family protein n=1 Tax=Enterobacter agglomerans TaxID=549 RepID=UPI003209876A
MPLDSFEQKLDTLNGEVPSILLGNGFSQAWRRDIFNYKVLYDRANFGARHNTLSNLFNQLGTFDFEKVMQTLDSALVVCMGYNVSQSIIDNIIADKEQLKNSLIQVITQSHPSRSSNVSILQYSNAKPFISQFEKVFTVNYDLLLYWIINKTEVSPNGYVNNDGFMRDCWIARPEQDVFFLHGGLHLYDNGTTIRKHTFNDDLNNSIAEQVETLLNNGQFPLFVSEPDAEKKLQRIQHNSYLNASFQAIKKLNGALFIHGHSMAENDKHIFDQICLSNVHTVFVGIFGDEYSDANRLTMANANRFLRTRKIDVEFYDSATANIW